MKKYNTMRQVDWGHFSIPRRMFDDDNLCATDLLVYAEIQRHKDAGGDICNLTTPEFCELLSVSRRTIQRSMARLEAGGYVVREITGCNKREILS